MVFLQPDWSVIVHIVRDISSKVKDIVLHMLTLPFSMSMKLTGQKCNSLFPRLETANKSYSAIGCVRCTLLSPADWTMLPCESVILILGSIFFCFRWPSRLIRRQIMFDIYYLIIFKTLYNIFLLLQVPLACFMCHWYVQSACIFYSVPFI